MLIAAPVVPAYYEAGLFLGWVGRMIRMPWQKGLIPCCTGLSLIV